MTKWMSSIPRVWNELTHKAHRNKCFLTTSSFKPVSCQLRFFPQSEFKRGVTAMTWEWSMAKVSAHFSSCRLWSPEESQIIFTWCRRHNFQIFFHRLRLPCGDLLGHCTVCGCGLYLPSGSIPLRVNWPACLPFTKGGWSTQSFLGAAWRVWKSRKWM